MPLKEYLAALDAQYRTGAATEHSYRPVLQAYLQELLPGYLVTNEPARIACGAPDYVITTRANGHPVAYVEAKDIDDPDLKGLKAHRAQFDRYKGALARVVFTDCLVFHLYIHGELAMSVWMGEADGRRIRPAGTQDEASLKVLVQQLVSAPPLPIVSPGLLAGLMAGKARLLREVMLRALEAPDGMLRGKYEELREKLIKDLKLADFADIYAQTIVYGLFAARLHCPAGREFTREHLAGLIPATNPLLRSIFLDLIVVNPEPQIGWLVVDLAEAFAQTDTARVMGGGGMGNPELDSGKARQEENAKHPEDGVSGLVKNATPRGAAPLGTRVDPLIHFYEDFLRAYDPAKRKEKGVWYTPQPIVRFIVRGVDTLLQRDFGLPQGLADSSLLPGRPQHRVQILDPATGTGTFLAEVVRQIYSTFTGCEGAWPQYVETHLLPRLLGFEILMVPYAIAHLKLEMLLRQTGYTAACGQRLGVYLTNALEGSADTERLATFIDREAQEANAIKRSGRVMVMLGNPPYNVASSNQSKWIKGLVADYKRNLGERTINSLSDDYIKFIRLGQHYIERNGRGIVAYVCNNRFLDGRIFFRMREELACAFDSIYIVNLHGDTRRKECTPDGGRDENVFGIMQGVCICIMVKRGERSDATGLERDTADCNATGLERDAARHVATKIATVYYRDLWGRREEKFEFLERHELGDIPFQKLACTAPSYYFLPKDFSLQEEYERGLEIGSIFTLQGKNGIETDQDHLCLRDTAEEARQLSIDAAQLPIDKFRRKYNNPPDRRNWRAEWAQKDVQENWNTLKIAAYAYRPFDLKFTVYTGRTKGILAWPGAHSFDCLLVQQNFALLLCKSISTSDFHHVFCTNELPDRCLLSNRGSETGYVFPLFTMRRAGERFFGLGDSLVPNLQPEAVERFEAIAGRKIAPEELFDYIYAVLHTPGYRQRYREFLKVDFPRIPLPRGGAHFEAMAEKGKALRKLHLLQDADRWALEATYPVAGSNEVESVRWEDERVYINAQQHFGGVPCEVWEFYIGGYQPAQKWLKDRRGKALDYEDIERYRRIVHALGETIRIMGELEGMWEEPSVYMGNS